MVPSFASGSPQILSMIPQTMSDVPRENTMLPLELTLVLAATRDMGIGMRGTLPWTGLKKEMAYFARITKRLPPEVSPCLTVISIPNRRKIKIMTVSSANSFAH